MKNGLKEERTEGLGGCRHGVGERDGGVHQGDISGDVRSRWI